MTEIRHRDGDPRNNELSNIDVVSTAESCAHELHELSVRFNGGNPVYTCDGCDTIVGRVKRPAPAVEGE